MVKDASTGRGYRFLAARNSSMDKIDPQRACLAGMCLAWIGWQHPRTCQSTYSIGRIELDDVG